MGCEDAAKVETALAADLEKLGGLYNDLEETTCNLECADKRKDERIHGLEERIRLLEDSCNPENTTRSEHVTGEPKTDKALAAPFEEQLAVHQTALASLSRSLQQLETRQPQSSMSTHELAQSLIQRLKGGDILSQSDLLHLQGALRTGSLGTLGHLPYTPPLTNVTTLQSHSDTDARQPQKRKPGRPPTRSSIDSRSEDEPPIKRPRGRPPRPSRESLTSDEPPIRRPRGRPPGRTLYRASLLSNQSSIEPLQDDATTENVAEVTPVADLDPVTIEGLNEVVENSAIYQATSTQAALQANVSESTELRSARSRQTLVAADFIGTINPNIDEQSDETDEPVEIPPERRSERAPKPAKKFGDVVTWTEAKVQMQGLKLRSPYKPRN